VHPGYGFLSENAVFARACASAGLTFVGPAVQTLETFGDKSRARAFARDAGVPPGAGTFAPTTLDQARAFFVSLGGGAMFVKALAGGGGRGMRVVRDERELAEAFERAASEAHAAFGDERLYVERAVSRARHIEVQILGDGRGAVAHAFERDCSLQRRRQKVLEIAPAPDLAPALRARAIEASLRLASLARYRSLGTFEFLLDLDADPTDPNALIFMEANARIQVEHPITEALTGIDLVRAQLEIAGGASLADLELPAWAFDARAIPPRGFALEARVNAETPAADGTTSFSGGTLARFAVPSGAGVRVDTAAFVGYAPSPRYDSLLAKVIVNGRGSFPGALALLRDELAAFEIDGVATNREFLLALCDDSAVRDAALTTTLVDERSADLVAAAQRLAAERSSSTSATASPSAIAPSLADIDPLDDLPLESVLVAAPMTGRIVSIVTKENEAVRAGATVAILDAMKMEHVVVASESGIVRRIYANADDVVAAGAPLVALEPATVADDADADALEIDLDRIRPDLAEALARKAATLDAARPAAVEKRHRTGGRTARENVDDLCDAGSFVEYGALTIPAQRRRRTLDDLIANAPADGLIGGIGDVNGALFGPERTRAMVLAYDYTVLAGTQGLMNHRKTDRLLQLAERYALPIVLFAEGGGGRPGDTDAMGVAGLDVMTFTQYARLSGRVPRVGIVSGRCFAGNAALLGCSDVVIATANATIGMGGPAMIEGGGLGIYSPEQVGPIEMQVPNGVVDVPVLDEREAVAVAKRYLAYFQGDLTDFGYDDQRMLRHVVPENRRRAYDMRSAIALLADKGSVLELRAGFGRGMITALARVAGKPFGVIANDPRVLAGAIDSDGADKGARFMQLCDAFGLPILSLCDTPGIMVGPDAERSGTVRHASRLFVTAASLRVPLFTIVLRKGYGLGAQAMAGGSFHASYFTVAWPTGEFGAMGLEGAVRLGFRKELEAIADPAERAARYETMVAEAYAHGKALNMASFLEIDDVIDPADTRRWIESGLRAHVVERPTDYRRTIDTW
jgi:acetyl-CoA carboxylase carboxyltransferase component/biotin carboxyl carrier protein